VISGTRIVGTQIGRTIPPNPHGNSPHFAFGESPLLARIGQRATAIEHNLPLSTSPIAGLPVGLGAALSSAPATSIETHDSQSAPPKKPTTNETALLAIVSELEASRKAKRGVLVIPANSKSSAWE
jgi:hypothetical protein